MCFEVMTPRFPVSHIGEISYNDADIQYLRANQITDFVFL